MNDVAVQDAANWQARPCMVRRLQRRQKMDMGQIMGQIMYICLLAVLLPCGAKAEALGLGIDEWHATWGSAPTLHQEAVGFSFDVPSKGTVNYLTRSYGEVLKLGGTLSMDITIKSSADATYRVVSNTSRCNPPAQVRFMVQRKGDDFYADNGRFWSATASIVLKNGTRTLTARLDPSIWTNVVGQHSKSGFNSVLNNMGNIGVTF